ncbi:MAG: CdaR family protein [Patescibacteria group bacterium]|jgi:YbbR domain-containing protein
MRLNSPNIMRWVILIAAVLVWINIYSFLDRTTTISAPLLIENLRSDFAIAEPITVVNATVSGGIRDFASLTDQTFQFTIDASSIAAIGQYTLEIKPKLVPKSVKVVAIEPQQLTATIELVASKIVPVSALSRGMTNDKYSVYSLTAVPSQVQVFGAPSLLAQISEARTYADVSRRKNSFTAPASVAVEDANNHVIHSLRVEPSNVKITVEIIAGAGIRNLGLKPSFIGELPGGFWVKEVKFDPSVVQVRGPQQILEALSSLSSTAINLSDHRSDFNEQVAVDLPSGIEIVGDNLIMAQILVGSSEGTRQLEIVPQYVNVTEGFSITATNPASIQVVVSGDPKAVNQLTRQDIKLNLDLKGTLSGANQIVLTPAMFSAPPNIQIVSFTPDKVEIVLTRL